MKRKALRRATALSVIALAAVICAPSGSAAPIDDYATVRADFGRDNVITPCRFTVQQLIHARDIADTNPEDSYNGFPGALETEIRRWTSGRCELTPGVPVNASFTVLATVTPKSVRVKQTKTFAFRVRARYRGKHYDVPGARVTFNARTRTTNRQGKASLRTRFIAVGAKRVTITGRGKRLKTITVRVLKAAPKKK